MIMVDFHTPQSAKKEHGPSAGTGIGFEMGD